MKDFIRISNGKSAGVYFIGDHSQEHKRNVVLKHVQEGFKREEGITWRVGKKLFNSCDVPQYDEEQTKQIHKYGQIVDGSKRPKYGKKRTITIWEDEK